MRTVMWTVFLVVALQGMASASTAFASPTPATATVSSDVASSPAASAERPDADTPKAEPAFRADSERKPAAGQPQVLSKNFQSPKPVQIYWFFGGR